jgi:hypothetical protein
MAKEKVVQTAVRRMIPTRTRWLVAMAASLSVTEGRSLAAQTAPNACSLLSGAEVVKLIERGKKSYGQDGEATSLLGGVGSVCDYADGQVGIWVGAKSEENFERFLKMWKADKATRHPVSEVGDRAWIMFPVPETKYKDRVAYVVAKVGQQTVTASLAAHDGAADGPMGEVCRGDQSRLKADEKEDCKKILADKSETQESLRPAAIELAKAVVAKVRAGEGSP